MIPLYSNQFAIVPLYAMLTTTHPLFLCLCEIPYNPWPPIMLATTHRPFLSLCGGKRTGEIHVRSASTPRLPSMLGTLLFPLWERREGGRSMWDPLQSFQSFGPAVINRLKQEMITILKQEKRTGEIETTAKTWPWLGLQEGFTPLQLPEDKQVLLVGADKWYWGSQTNETDSPGQYLNPRFCPLDSAPGLSQLTRPENKKN